VGTRSYYSFAELGEKRKGRGGIPKLKKRGKKKKKKKKDSWAKKPSDLIRGKGGEEKGKDVLFPQSSIQRKKGRGIGRDLPFALKT